MHREGRLVDLPDARLHILDSGQHDGYPLFALHGGPGLDHHEFGDYLDPLTDRGVRLILVDQRSQGRSPATPESTWTLEKMADDICFLAQALGLDRYAVLGHSFGAFVALQHAVDFPGMATQTIVSGGVPSSSYLAAVEANLAAIEPAELRERIAASWEREASAQTSDDVLELLYDQLPFFFADLKDPRAEAYFDQWLTKGVYAPDVLRSFAVRDYGGIEVADRLGDVPQRVLVLTGRHDRVCTVEAAEAIANGVPNGELVVFEASGHSAFIEEHDAYVDAVAEFLDRTSPR
jgi:proline iminopeptidase